MSQFARPTSDVSTGGWLPTPLWQQLDESVADDGATEVITSVFASTDFFTIKLGALADPAVDTGHVLRIRLRDAGFPGFDGYNFSLKQGAAIIASGSEPADGSSAWKTVTLALTSPQAASITDYTDLRVEMSFTDSTGIGSTAEVSQIEFEVPDAGGGSPSYAPPGVYDDDIVASGRFDVDV